MLSSSSRYRAKSACLLSAWELTEMYSPVAVDMAPVIKPATPATSTLPCEAREAATPTTKLAVEIMPSLAPRTAARNQPMRCVRCYSRCLIGGEKIKNVFYGCRKKERELTGRIVFSLLMKGASDLRKY